MNNIFINIINNKHRVLSILMFGLLLFQTSGKQLIANSNPDESTPFTVVVVTTDIVCHGLCDGSALAVVTGGTPPFTFLWDNGDTRQHLDWEPAGYYEVTVTDADGHTAVAGGTINEPPPIDIDLQLTLNGGCNTGSTADAYATATGGTPGYTYEWSTGAWGQSVTNLTPGNYWLTVTDANLCKEGLDFVVDPVNNGLRVDVTVNPGDCGANNATATGIASGGTAPYNYRWEPGSVLDPTITGLAPGTYTLFVTDADGCAGQETVVISPSGSLTVNAAGRDISCGGINDGAAQAMASGGTPPYSYLWSNGSMDSGIDDLAPGLYTVTVNDSGGCTGSTMVLINDRPAIVLTTSSTSSDCNASNGTATVVATGGTPPFTYLWCDGQTAPTAVGLPGIVCSVIVTDAAGCTATTVVTVGENTDLIAVIDDETDADCGTSNGTATVSATGGTMPYSYLWCNGQTTATVTGLGAGSCTVTVTDAEGCRATATATIDQNQNLDVDAVPDFSDCTTPATSATANVAGGTPLFTYLWSDGQITQTAVNLAPGTYIVTVTDANGCIGSDSVTVGDPPPPLSPDFDWEFLECFDNDSMRVQFNDLTNVSGANCVWDFGNGQTALGPNPVIVLTGSPTDVTLTKSLGVCMGEITKTVILPFIDITLSGPGDGCVGEVLQVTAVNNSSVPPNITYDWFPDDLISGGDSTDTVTVFSDTSGTFQICVAVMNDLGCLDTICTDYLVSDPPPAPDSLCYDQCEGLTIDFYGIPPGYLWDFGDPSNSNDTTSVTNPSYTYPDTGRYKVTLIPILPCLDTICQEIVVCPAPYVHFTCELDECIDTAKLTIYDSSFVKGPITSWSWTVISINDTTNVQTDTVQNPAFCFTKTDTYEVTLEVTWGKFCTMSDTKVLDITCLGPSYTVKVDSICFGDTIKLEPNSEPDITTVFPPDSCVFRDSMGMHYFVASKEGIYTYVVNESRGPCNRTKTFVFCVFPEIEVEISGDSLLCDTIPLQLIASGKDSVYSYRWATSPDFDTIIGTTDTLNHNPMIFPITYYLMVTDTSLCEKIYTYTVDIVKPNIDIVGDPVICIGDSTLLVLSNGNPGDSLIIVWSPNDIILSGQGTDSVWVMPIDDATVVAEVTNQYGCMETDTFQIQVNNANEGLEIHAELLPTGDEKTTIYAWQDSTQLFATEGYETYTWDPESTLDPFDVSDPIAKPMTSTNYQLTVTDEEGCIGNAEILITVLQPPCGRPHVFLPNAFTPGNSDGRNLNDMLYVRGNIIDEVHLMIYNRWGEKVFETFDQSVGWNGEFGDKGVCPDVYGYYLTVTCFNGENYVEKGNITVLR